MNDQVGDPQAPGTPQGQPAAGDNPAPAGSVGSNATTGTDSSARPGWMDQLKGDLKDHEGLRKFESASDLAKSYVELEGKLGKAVTISEKPTDEELSRVRTLLGVPESAEGYNFADLKQPEGFKFTDAYLREFREFAHSQGKTTAQARADLERMAEREFSVGKEIRRIIKTQQEESEKKLRTDWGGDYDKYIKAGETVLLNFADPELMAGLKDSGFINNPSLKRFLANVGNAVNEGSAPREGKGSNGEPKYEGDFPVAAKMAARRNEFYKR